ncbi:MAG: iron-containing alcohol dehydrogenase [Clostridiales bacterium]|nr:iron-containing alcohol dehydrogenase [Clostridiales bacterium]
MNNFCYYSPTKYVFGKGEENNVGTYLTAYAPKKVLVVYGGQSAEKSGLLGRVRESLKGAGIEFVELGGVKPNPRYELALEGMELSKKEGVDFVLAVGGGSVIDTAKCIAIGVVNEGDVWDTYYAGDGIVTKALPVASILTIAAAGSEGSNGTVITYKGHKFSTGSDALRPVLAILNPELTMTLPAYQTACGVSDIFTHLIERYFTNTPDVSLTDEMCEGLMRNIFKYGKVAVEHPDDYNARAQVMWTGTLAHNDICGCDRDQDWASHQIQHEIGAKYDSAHGAGLATVFPAWAKYVYKHDIPRFVRFATKVMGVDNDVFHPEEVVLEGIARVKAYMSSIGLPTTKEELGVKEEDIPQLANIQCGGFVPLGQKEIMEIYQLMV